MSEKHTPGLTREQVFGIADKYGAFEFGDAQGHKRLAFAADVIAAHERVRDAAPELLEVLQGILKCERGMLGHLFLEGWQEDVVRAAIARATGEPK